MFRGYFGGAFWGLVTSVLGLGTLSLVAPQPAGNLPPQQPVVESPDLAEASGGSTVDEVVPEVTADAGGAPAPSDTPEVGVAGTDVPVVQSDTTPLEQPDAGEVTTGLTLPSTTEGPVVTAGAEQPVLPNPQALVPDEPEGETDLSLDTQAAAEPEVGNEIPEVVAIVDEPVVEDGESAADVVEPAEVVPEAETDTDAAVPEAVAEDQPAVVERDEPAEDVADAGPEAPTLVAPEVDGTLPVTPSTDEDNDGGSSLIALQGDAAPLPGDGSVRIIGDETDEEAAGAEATDEESADVDAAATGAALMDYAAAFEMDEVTPLMSVILIDDGSLAGAEAALGQMPVPVTVALDPAASGAAEKMAAYRAAGFEVMALAEVPAGALPTDVAVTLQAGFATLPEAIGLLDIGQAGLQSSREVSEQAMTQLADAGRGFVTFSQGLNSGLRAADAADVAAVSVYRDLDAEDQDARVIRRFLDQAAFRARQQGVVVLVGRVRADTISALTLWGTSNQDGPVTMAPVSAVLLAQ